MTTILEASGITFGYENNTPVLLNWAAGFSAGELVAVTGASGSGKSTLLYILGLMLRPSQGTVWLDGVDMESLPDRARSHVRAHQFGFVFQDSALNLNRTVLDNVVESALYRGESPRRAYPRAQALLAQFGVTLQSTSRPGQVSGGQAQRIALCRALLGSPKLLLADEPTGNLDPRSAGVVMQAFRDHSDRGGLTIVVTHDPLIAQMCDRTLEL